MDSGVTFLLTDVEDSVRAWNRYPDEAMRAAIERHHAILVRTIEAHRGEDFSDTGDGRWAAFPDAADAITAAVEMQRRLLSTRYDGGVGTLRVRMGIHTGHPIRRGDNYCGSPVNLTARVSASAHGGQIIVTEAAAAAAAGRLGPGIELLSLGSHRYRDFPDPVVIHQVTHDDLPLEFAPLDSVGQLLPRLETPATSFVGRDGELRALSAALDAHRVLTLTGPPGVGKSRLALELANLVRNRFELGAHALDRERAGPEGLIAALATQLGVSRANAPTGSDETGAASLEDLVIAVLGENSALLVLDGFRPADRDVHELAARIARDCPASRVVITSPAPFGLASEQVWAIRPLPVAAEDAPTSQTTAAEQLFYDRARLADPSFVAGPSTVEPVRAVCRAVDGLPLAIELIAARVRLRTARQLLDEVDGLLDLGQPMALREVLSGTIERLPANVQRTIAELSAFVGWFRRAVAVEVCDSLDDAAGAQSTLDVLMSRSLLEHRSDGIDSYYRLLGPINALCAERADRAGLTPELARRHRDAYVAEATEASRQIRGHDEITWVARLEADLPEVQRAFDRLLETGDTERGTDLVVAMWPHAYTRMWEPFWGWVDRLLEELGTAATPELLGIAALGAWRQGRSEEAIELAERALAAENDLDMAPTIPARLALLDAMGAAPGRHDVMQIGTELFAAAEATGEAYWIVNGYVLAAIGLASMGDSTSAIRFGEAGLTRARENANPSTLAWGYFGAGMAYESTDPAYADALLDESVRVARTVGCRWVETIALSVLGVMRLRIGGGRDAAPILLDLHDRFARSGFPALQWRTVLESGLALIDVGRLEAGLTLVSAADRAGATRLCLPTETERAAAGPAHVERAIGTVAAERAVARGRVAGLAQMVELARTELGELLDPA